MPEQKKRAGDGEARPSMSGPEAGLAALVELGVVGIGSLTSDQARLTLIYRESGDRALEFYNLDVPEESEEKELIEEIVLDDPNPQSLAYVELSSEKQQLTLAAPSGDAAERPTRIPLTIEEDDGSFRSRPAERVMQDIREQIKGL